MLVKSIKVTKNNIAKGIVQRMKDLACSVKENTNSVNKVFDQVLNMNVIGGIAEGCCGEEGGGGGGGECDERGYDDDQEESSSSHEKKMSFKSAPRSREARAVSEESEIIKARAAAPKYYKKLEDTKEFCETYYYGKVPGQENLINYSSAIFADLAESYLNNSQ